MPVGVVGELYIGGVQVGRGYHNGPELTAEKFVADPYSVDPCARLYRTGDLVRYLEDGNIEYLGRKDFQVKVRGHRIELGEIEVHLLECKGVDACAVTVREDRPGEKRLVAYVVPKPGASIEGAALREQLRSKIPGYMVPSTIMFLERLPLTPNGKVNRKALPAPPSSTADCRSRFHYATRPGRIGPGTAVGRAPRDQPIGVNDNFFDLGGNSLLAIRLYAQIEASFGKQIPLSALFQTPTIANLATVLRQDATPAAWTSLVPVRTNGSRPALFLVHGHRAMRSIIGILPSIWARTNHFMPSSPWGLRDRRPITLSRKWRMTTFRRCAAFKHTGHTSSVVTASAAG